MAAHGLAVVENLASRGQNCGIFNFFQKDPIQEQKKKREKNKEIGDLSMAVFVRVSTPFRERGITVFLHVR